MTETDLRTQIWWLRAAFLMNLARRLGLEADKETVRELVQTRDDAAVRGWCTIAMSGW
jgi:hypothetical protein